MTTTDPVDSSTAYCARCETAIFDPETPQLLPGWVSADGTPAVLHGKTASPYRCTACGTLWLANEWTHPPRQVWFLRGL